MADDSETFEILHALLDERNSGLRNKIFQTKFQSYSKFTQYFTSYFYDGVMDASDYNIHEIWKKKSLDTHWSSVDFHLLYIACWVYKPVEKGTFFIRMTGSEARNVKKGFDQLPSRKSSHLDGKGRSARHGWKFLKGYKELLVQWRDIDNRSYLLLKAEGHTTVGFDLIKHGASFVSKAITGSGMTANKSLKSITRKQYDDSPIIARAAENFGSSYKTFLKDLKSKTKSPHMNGSQTSVRNMLSALTANDWNTSTNLDVQNELNRIANGGLISNTLLDHRASKINQLRLDKAQDMPEQFKRFAKLFELENRPKAVYTRFFEEVHVNPAQLSNAVKEFMGFDLPVSTISQSQRRSEMSKFKS